MSYVVNERYTYTGDSIFDSAGEFKVWYHAVDSDFLSAVQTATGSPFDASIKTLKESQTKTETWNIDDQILDRYTTWPDKATYLTWDNYLKSFDYTHSAFNSVTIGGMGLSDPALDVNKQTRLPDDVIDSA